MAADRGEVLGTLEMSELKKIVLYTGGTCALGTVACWYIRHGEGVGVRNVSLSTKGSQAGLNSGEAAERIERDGADGRRGGRACSARSTRGSNGRARKSRKVGRQWNMFGKEERKGGERVRRA